VETGLKKPQRRLTDGDDDNDDDDAVAVAVTAL